MVVSSLVACFGHCLGILEVLFFALFSWFEHVQVTASWLESLFSWFFFWTIRILSSPVPSIGYPKGSALELLAGTLKLLHCTDVLPCGFHPDLYPGLVMVVVKYSWVLLVTSGTVGKRVRLGPALLSSLPPFPLPPLPSPLLPPFPPSPSLHHHQFGAVSSKLR